MLGSCSSLLSAAGLISCISFKYMKEKFVMVDVTMLAYSCLSGKALSGAGIA